MDESLQDLENELMRLRPRVPSSRLLARIDTELAKPTRLPESLPATQSNGLVHWSWLNWRTAAAAAAVVAFATIVINSPHSTPGGSRADTPSAIVAKNIPTVQANPVGPEIPAAAPLSPNVSYHPVGATSVLYDLREDGTVSISNSTPVHRVRYRYLDTYTWKSPATNASLKWSLPRDEVRVIPASLH